MKYFIYKHEGKVLTGIAIIYIVGLVLAGYNAESIKCQDIAEGLSMKYKYTLSAGCRVEIDGKLVPLENYRFNNGVSRMEYKE